MPWYDNDASGWDERTNTLTFHTFRPPSQTGSNKEQQPMSDMHNNSSVTNGNEPNDYRPINNAINGSKIPMPKRRPPYTYIECAIAVCLLPGETRVGFAMCGGKEDCYPSIVNNIIRGSPADRAGLSIGDEIIEVNGVSVEDASHGEIVQHIHQCIKSRTIQLRVRRKQSVSPDPADLNITDAYLVSVDREQRKNLDRKLKNSYPGIKTHDMETVHDRLKAGKDPLNESEIPLSEMEDENQNKYLQKPNGQIQDPEMENLKKYEEELRKRKENDNKIAKEREFLRTSLRESKKLQALEIQKKTPKVTGFENACYDPNDRINENGKRPLELQEVLASVDRVAESLDRMPEHRSEALFIKDLFHKEPVQNAIELTATVHQNWSHRTPSIPGTSEAHLYADGVLSQLGDAISDDAAELQTMLEDPHFKALMHSHDQIAERLHPGSSGSSTPQEAPIGLKETPLSPKGDANLRIVKLFKQDDNYLGATVRQDGDRVVIGRIVKGGVVEKCHLLNEGDELLEVNGQQLKNKTVNEVCDLLRNMSGEIIFVICPRSIENGKSSTDSGYLSNGQTQQSQVRHMRALFDYEPEDDFYVPCKELALQFQKGDILHVISMTDEDWWQAYREGDDPSQSLAGLIPSAGFQTKREQYNREIMGENRRPVQPKHSEQHSLLCAKRSKRLSKKPKVTHLGGGPKVPLDQDENEEHEILTYEEVSLYLSRTGRKRPIILVGPTNVGCLDLRQKLMESDKEKFAGIVPNTSRPRKTGEQDGVHYNFVSRQKFQEDVKQGKFVEWGEFQKHYYGTMFSSIKQVVERGKTCVLTLKAQSLKVLVASTLMPFIVFISPPSLQQLKVQKLKQGAQNVKDEDLKSIICDGKSDEDLYGHIFDKVIVNIDLERTFQELRTIIHRLETEPQWVPKKWLDGQDSLRT